MRTLRWRCLAAGTYWSSNEQYRISHHGQRWWVYSHIPPQNGQVGTFQLLTRTPRTLDEAMSWATTHYNYRDN